MSQCRSHAVSSKLRGEWDRGESDMSEPVLRIEKLIDGGMGMTLADAMKLEARLSAEDAASVTAESIAVRTDAVRDRGRSQGAG
jgi:hypothetical protein